jgi:hypothetical protein
MKNQNSEYLNKLYFIRGVFVMLDRDLSSFYNVDTKGFNKAMNRKKEDFNGIAFKLKKEEHQEILIKNKEKRTTSHLPTAYTEKAAYKMAFILSSKTSLKVADTILEVFVSVRAGLYLPKTNDNQLALLNENVQWIKNNMQGTIVNNTFHAPVTLIQGENNQVSVGNSEDVILRLITLMNNADVVRNKELLSLLTKSIEQANINDNNGLLESLQKVSSVGSGIMTVAKQIPEIIKIVSSLF